MKALKMNFIKEGNIVTCKGCYSFSLKNYWIPWSYIKKRLPIEWNVMYIKERDSIRFIVETKARCRKEDKFDLKEGKLISKTRNLQTALMRQKRLINIIKKYLHNRYNELAFRYVKLITQSKKLNSNNF